jgi:hypothetical protein
VHSVSRWSLPSSGVSITPIVTPEANSVGDVMRELDTKQIITSDFILVTGDVVSTIPLQAVLREHKERRKVSKDCIMTMVYKPAGPRDRPRQVDYASPFHPALFTDYHARTDRGLIRPSCSWMQRLTNAYITNMFHRDIPLFPYRARNSTSARMWMFEPIY